MGNSHNQKNLRFNINSSSIRGSFLLSFEPYIISQIEEEIDSFISCLRRKQNKDGIFMQKSNNGYDINLKAIPVICNKVFSVLKSL